MLPLRLAARGCVTAAREGCSKFAFTTRTFAPAPTESAAFHPCSLWAQPRGTPPRDLHAVLSHGPLPLVRTTAPGAKCGQISDTPNVILALFTLPAGHSRLTSLTCRAPSHRSDQPCLRCRRSPRQ